MAFTDCLREVVSDRWQRSPDSEGNVTLKEPRVMSVQVSELSQYSVVVRPHKLSLSGVKNGPWKQSCDFIIVNPHGDTVRVLFIELKHTLNNERKGLEQLRWSLPRLEYLRSLCHIHCGDRLERFEVHYVLIGKKGSPRFDKQPVRSAGSPETIQHKGIEVGLHIVSRHVRFSRLWGN